MAKKRIHIKDASPEMVLAADLLSDAGRIILGKGTRLTEALLQTLRAWDISYLELEQAVMSPTLPTHFQASHCEKKYADTLSLIENSFATMRLCGELPLAEMQELAVSSVMAMTESVGVLQYLHTLRRTGEYTFHHSVNVSVMCGILGKWMGYSGSELQDIVLAGLLHDVGKSQVSAAIVNKPERLTTEEMYKMKEHSALGVELMRKAGVSSSSVMSGVLQHHERANGSGYPGGTSGASIHPYARILAIADLYDAVTSDRPFLLKQSPFAAARIISQEMFDTLDMETATTFLEHIRDHFVGTHVRLSDGRSAEVIMLGTDFTFKPVIRTENGEFIDTGRNSAVHIKEVVSF